MQLDTDHHSTNWTALFLISLCSCLFTFYIIFGLNQVADTYAYVQKEFEKPVYRGNANLVTFPGSEGTLNIPNWQFFSSGDIWSLVSKDRPLNDGFSPNNLIDVTLPHGDAGTEMQIDSKIVTSLSSLFTAAEQAGKPLMISSAYRSINDQKLLYDQFVDVRGKDAADMYVADPGSSEHHTGLAVDLSDLSTSCAADSDKCLISPDTSLWLADNVHRYGFIVRYPEGSQPITGVAYEPWHYRYVGIPLANKIYQSALTLDEALIQMYPAFRKPLNS